MRHVARNVARGAEALGKTCVACEDDADRDPPSSGRHSPETMKP
jgi:hypothetical protein